MPSRSLGRASLVLLGSTWVHSGLGILGSILVARGLGPGALGDLAVNLGVAGLIMAVLMPGFLQAHLKRLAEGQEAGRCIGTMAAVQAGLTGVLGLALAAAWLLTPAERLPGSAVLAFMLAAQATGRFAEAFQRVFLAQQWVVAHGAVVVGARLTRLGAIVVVLLAAPSVTWVAATFWLESLVTLVVAATVLATRYGIRMSRPTRASIRGYWTYARPFLITTPIALLQDSIDRVLVGRWAGLDAAGYYHVARGLWEVLGSVLAPPALLLFTRLSALYAERSPERDHEARDLFLRGLDKLLFLTTPLAVALWSLADWIIEALYGAAFAPAVTPVRVLVVAALVANVVNPYTYVLHAQDLVTRFVPLNLVRFAVYLALLAALVWGSATAVPWLPTAATGAALARLVLLVFPAWIWIGWARDTAGIPFLSRGWLYFAAFGLSAAAHAATAAVASALDAGAHVGQLTAAIVAFAGYAAVIGVAHPAAQEHLRYAATLLPLGEVRGRRGLL